MLLDSEVTGERAAELLLLLHDGDVMGKRGVVELLLHDEMMGGVRGVVDLLLLHDEVMGGVRCNTRRSDGRSEVW